MDLALCKGKTGSPELSHTAVAPNGKMARNIPTPVLCLTKIRVAGGAKAMEKQQSVSHNRAVWANVAKGWKSNPLIDKVWDSVARGSVQQDIYAQCCRTQHKIL